MPASSDHSRRAVPLVPHRRPGAGPSPSDAAGHPPVLLVLPELPELAPSRSAAPTPHATATPPTREHRTKTSEPPPEAPRIKLPQRPIQLPTPVRPSAPAATPESAPPRSAGEPSAAEQSTGEQNAAAEDRQTGSRRRRSGGKSNSGGVNWFSLLSVMFMGGIILFAAATWITGWRPWRKSPAAPIAAEHATEPAEKPASPKPIDAPREPAGSDSEPRLAAKPAPPPAPAPVAPPEPKPQPKPAAKPAPIAEKPPAAPSAPPPPAPASPASPQTNAPAGPPPPSVGSYPRTPLPAIANPVRPSAGSAASYPQTRGAPPAPASAPAAATDPALGEYPRLEALRTRPELRGAMNETPGTFIEPSGATLQPAYDPESREPPMSALDQAFIKAYSREREPLGVGAAARRAAWPAADSFDPPAAAARSTPAGDVAPQALRFDFGAGAVPAPVGPIWPWNAPAIPPGYHPGVPHGYYPGHGPAMPAVPHGINPALPAWGPWNEHGGWTAPVAPHFAAPRTPAASLPPAVEAPATGDVIMSYAGESSADLDEPSLAMGPVVVQSTFEEELISPALGVGRGGAGVHPAVALAQNPCCVPRAAAEQAASHAPVAPLAWEPTRAPSQPVTAPQARFHPHWEVEQFAWPAACDRLLAAQEGAFAGLLERILLAAVNGQKVVAVAGCSPGDGKSTLALCLAREAARAGLSTALVDADFERPRLAELLGVDPPRGWEEALAGEMPLVETSVASAVDGVHLVPLRPGRAAPSDERTAALLEALELLADRHDLVLVDMGTIPADEPAPAGSPPPEKLMGAIIVRDCRRVSEDQALCVAQHLRAAGVEVLGRADNFRR